MATSIDLAHRLLATAENDELMAKSVLPVPGVTDAGVGQLTHAAVEKAMKAIFAANEVEFPFTHNLRMLRELAQTSGIELPATLDGMEALTPFASDERYGAETPLTLDRDQAMNWAEAAIAWARGIIEDIEPKQDATGLTSEAQAAPEPDS